METNHTQSDRIIQMNFTDPHDIKDVLFVCSGWNEEGVANQVKRFESQGYPYVAPFIDRNHHETVNMNRMIDMAAERGMRYAHLVDYDVEYRYTETVPAMYDYIKNRPDVGAVHPWMQGEDADPTAEPYDFYLQDGTSLLLRLDINGWLPQFDEEFLFTGWSDLDLGENIHHHGALIMNDKRYPVKHDLGNTRRRSQCSFLMANERRNRLILSLKWFVVGITKWRGVNEYNKTVPRIKQVPSMYELATYTDDELETWWRSIWPEHPQIWRKDGELDPVDNWETPVIGGRNIREMWEQGWRPT